MNYTAAMYLFALLITWSNFLKFWIGSPMPDKSSLVDFMYLQFLCVEGNSLVFLKKITCSILSAFSLYFSKQCHKKSTYVLFPIDRETEDKRG